MTRYILCVKYVSLFFSSFFSRDTVNVYLAIVDFYLLCICFNSKKRTIDKHSLNYGDFIILGDFEAITDSKVVKDSCN